MLKAQHALVETRHAPIKLSIEPGTAVAAPNTGSRMRPNQSAFAITAGTAVVLATAPTA